MKPVLFLSTILLPFALFSVDSSVANGFTPSNMLDCENASEMSCNDNFSISANFIDGTLSDENSRPSCLDVVSGFELKEFWVELDLTGYVNYFLDGSGVNGGYEIYSGSCNNLELVSCEPSQGNSTYFGFYAPAVSTYYVRVFGYDYQGGSNFNLTLHGFAPLSTCDLSIDNIEVALCRDKDDMVDIALSGSIEDVFSGSPLSVEILTDEGLYFFDGSILDSQWTANFEIEGSEITYISMWAGDSESGCFAGLYSIALPETSCDDTDVSGLIGNVIWNANCAERSAELKYYTPGTNSLIGTYDIVIANNGHFQIAEPEIGVFDMVLHVEGCISKGFSDVNVGANVLNTMDCGTISRGDVNNDNLINIVDMSIIVNFFGQNVPANQSTLLDLNCDAGINIVDFSILSSSYGMLGSTAPL